MLAIEGATMLINGFYLTIFGCWDVEYTPFYVGASMIQLLPGAGLATSALAGVFFLHMSRGMDQGSSNVALTFWKTYKKRMIFLFIICVFTDLFTPIATAYYVPYFNLLCGFFQIVANATLGFHFVRATANFLRRAQGAMIVGSAGKGKDKQVWRMLLCSAR